MVAIRADAADGADAHFAVLDRRAYGDRACPARPSGLNAALRGNLACDQAGGLPLKKFTNLASFCTSYNS